MSESDNELKARGYARVPVPDTPPKCNHPECPYRASGKLCDVCGLNPKNKNES